MEEKGSEWKGDTRHKGIPVPWEMSPTFPREGKWGLNLVNGSALAILVVRGAAERLFATLCVRGLFCFVF